MFGATLAGGRCPFLRCANPQCKRAGLPMPHSPRARMMCSGPVGAPGSPGSPEDGLGDALARLAVAPDAATATPASPAALTIPEGTGSCSAGSPDEKKAYCGIALLNYDAPAKVKTVPANGTVDVTE